MILFGGIKQFPLYARLLLMKIVLRTLFLLSFSFFSLVEFLVTSECFHQTFFCLQESNLGKIFLSNAWQIHLFFSFFLLFMQVCYLFSKSFFENRMARLLMIDKESFANRRRGLVRFFPEITFLLAFFLDFTRKVHIAQIEGFQVYGSDRMADIVQLTNSGPGWDFPFSFLSDRGSDDFYFGVSDILFGAFFLTILISFFTLIYSRWEGKEKRAYSFTDYFAGQFWVERLR